MHIIQQKLLELSKKKSLADLTLRKMAQEIGMPDESPQKIKHHLQQLEKLGFFTLDRSSGYMARAATSGSISLGLLNNKAKLFSIPIVGTANCGPATIFAEQNFEGFLRVSSTLVGRANPNGLFAIKADGSSMNRAQIGEKKIENGDYMIIDSQKKDVKTGDAVLAIVDDKATVKRLIIDKANNQIVLKADSSYDYEPIYLHHNDSFSVSGKVVAVVKNSR